MEQVYFARQPIFDLNNKTYGYELLYRNHPEVNAYTGDNGDVSTADVINNAFLVDNVTSFLDGKKAFVRMLRKSYKTRSSYDDIKGYPCNRAS